MPLNSRALVDRPFPLATQTYGPHEAILYALGIGLGMQPTETTQLPHLIEDAQGEVDIVPSMACVLAFPAPWGTDPAVGADWRRVVHVEQRVEFLSPLPRAGATVRARACVERVTDKGAAKGALVQASRTVEDAETGQALARITMVSLARGDGGCGPAERPGAPVLDKLPDTPPGPADHAEDALSSPQSALIYRLSGDRNPLHADPAAADAAGFDRPILHGLCTFGIATHRVIARMLGGDGSRLATIGCQFSDVVYPGETLRVECWRAAHGIHFRVGVPARRTVALSRGFASFRS